MTYEEYLAKYGELTYRNVGVSMLPLIRQGRDTFTVRAMHPGRSGTPLLLPQKGRAQDLSAF